MPPTQQRILETFLQKLTTTAEFDAARLAQLQSLLFHSTAKLKPLDLVKVFSTDAGARAEC